MAEVQAWERAGILFETYTYDPGPGSSLPVHTHEYYQWCLSVDFPGYYHYRGTRYPVPTRAISVIHPFELHAASDPHQRDSRAKASVTRTTTTVAVELRPGGWPRSTPSDGLTASSTSWWPAT
jgi:hypothetical protein